MVAEPAPIHAEPAAPTGLSCPAVEVYGSMQRFKQGDLSQTVALSELTWTDAAAALGATADKTAEITAFDGKIWIVAPSADGVAVSHDTKDQGGSLVATAAPTTWDAGRRVDSVDVASILSAVETARSGTGCAQAEAVPFVVALSANLAGHLNAIALRPGATLHLPATEG